MEFKSTININASPDDIWAILTDGAAFPDWEPNVTKVEGTIAAGEKITVHTKVSPNQAFPVTVSEFTPGKKMVWTGGMPLGLFKGERSFTLEPQSDGTTQVTTHEVFSGLLKPIMARMIPDLTESFEQFSAGLKSRAES